jgi:hypothetical protein
MHFALKTGDYFAGAPMPADGEQIDGPEKFRGFAETIREIARPVGEGQV